MRSESPSQISPWESDSNAVRARAFVGELPREGAQGVLVAECAGGPTADRQPQQPIGERVAGRAGSQAIERLAQQRDGGGMAVEEEGDVAVDEQVDRRRFGADVGRHRPRQFGHVAVGLAGRGESRCHTGRGERPDQRRPSAMHVEGGDLDRRLHQDRHRPGGLAERILAAAQQPERDRALDGIDQRRRLVFEQRLRAGRSAADEVRVGSREQSR